MAENTRDSKKDDQKDQQKGKSSDWGEHNAGSNEQISTNRGLADMDAEPSIGTNKTTRGSGISTKRSVTGSDYDGQVSGE